MGARRAARDGGVHTEEHADADGHDDGQDRDRQRQEDAGVGQRGEDEGADDAEGDAEEPAGEAEQRGLDEELAADEPGLRAERLAEADLPDALGDRDQHDVHDADAAHEQRDDGDAAQHHGQRPVDRAGRGQDRLLGGDREVRVVVGGDAVEVPQEWRRSPGRRPTGCPPTWP